MTNPMPAHHHDHAQTPAPAIGESPAQQHLSLGTDAGHEAHMVQDMLRRFIGSAILTVPIIFYSPLGTSLAGRELVPPFGLSHGILGFVLTSIVVWWGGWPFVSAAWRSLRHGELTMMTLIATGVLVSYRSPFCFAEVWRPSDVRVPRLLRVSELAALTGLPRWRIYELLQMGEGTAAPVRRQDVPVSGR